MIVAAAPDGAGSPKTDAGTLQQDKQQTIRFNQPSLEGNELEYIRESVEKGHTSSSGPFGSRVKELLTEETGAADVHMTTSCTAALEIAAMMLDLEPGDTVVVPSFTFVSTALAFARGGARIIFCDIESETLGIDPDHLASVMDDSVRAVVPVHYAGVAGDIDGLLEALKPWQGVDIIEDNAHGLFGRWRGQPLGSLGRFAALSFHETKNFVCGEGGALLVNDESDVDRSYVLYDKGTNRRAFFLGQVDKYSWMDTGSSFGLADSLAAYLWAQLEQREVILNKRRAVWDRYFELLKPHAAEYGFSMPVVPDDCLQGYHMFYVLLPDNDTRNRVLRDMRGAGVQPTFHYVPLHSSEGGRKFSAKPTDCPVTDDISGRLLRLPFYNNLSASDADRVVATFLEAFGS
jgi:dTDP-4-amino-4,6-dideoxygalactose transaminase